MHGIDRVREGTMNQRNFSKHCSAARTAMPPTMSRNAMPITGHRRSLATAPEGLSGYTEDTILCGSFKLRSEAESERDGEEF